MAEAAIAHTVLEAMIAIGIENVVLFDGQTQAERIAEGIFEDDFESCIDKTDSEIDDDLKMWSNLTLANGQIRLQPIQKKRLKAFSQWVKDKVQQGIDPANKAFDSNMTQELI